MPPTDSLPDWFWWHYGTIGALLWAAVGVVWWYVGDIESAMGTVCRAVGFYASWAGFGLAAFWLVSTAFAAGIILLVLPIVAVSRMIERRKAK